MTENEMKGRKERSERKVRKRRKDSEGRMMKGKEKQIHEPKSTLRETERFFQTGKRGSVLFG